MESIEMFPNKSAVALTNVEDELYTIDLIETPRQLFVSAVMTRDELLALYFQIDTLVFPSEEGGFQHSLMAENSLLKQKLKVLASFNVVLSRRLAVSIDRCIELQEEIERDAK